MQGYLFVYFFTIHLLLMNICMYACTYIHTYIYMYVWVYACIYLCMLLIPPLQTCSRKHHKVLNCPRGHLIFVCFLIDSRNHTTGLFSYNWHPPSRVFWTVEGYIFIFSLFLNCHTKAMMFTRWQMRKSRADKTCQFWHALQQKRE